jgi:lycopene beta-cyclase
MAGSADRLIICGGGLSGCLAALALARLRPEVSILLVEEGERFGGNHVWSFFDSDVAPSARWLVEPLVAARWESYDIRFPKRRRTLATPYNSAKSDRLDTLVRERLPPDQYRLGARVERLEEDGVWLAGGERLDGTGVIDARGPKALPGLELGWQKFVGREYSFAAPHGLERPLIMDATVDQDDGYRFVYCLPFSPTRMLVEDTYYSLSAKLDTTALGQRIEAYVADRSWPDAQLENEEQGLLPVAIGGSLDAIWEEGPRVPRIGLRGGFFHPTTGYSLPDAVRTALRIAGQADLGTAALYAALRSDAERLWRRRRFYRLLNRMLFHAAPPPERYKVLEHFYRLDAAAIARFYTGGSTLADKLRILSGKPPVPVARAARALLAYRSGDPTIT